jgi:hypothetical protein
VLLLFSSLFLLFCLGSDNCGAIIHYFQLRFFVFLFIFRQETVTDLLWSYAICLWPLLKATQTK